MSESETCYPSYSNCADTVYAYLGESIWVTDPENNTTKTEHNAVGQIVKVTDANSNYATYTYKPFGELATMTDAESHTTTIGYDARGLKSSMSDPNMGSWSYAYSLYGELASQTNALSQTTTLTYDEAGRLYQRVEPEGTTTWSYYAYNDSAGARGKLYSVAAPDSYSELYSYYTAGAYIGQPAWVRRTIDSTDYYYYMAYDSLGRLSRLTYPTSSGGYTFKADYEYDAYGQLQYVKDGNETYTYYTLNSTDALGRERSVTLGNGRTETRDYDDAAGHLKTIQTDGSVQNLTMTYDEVGNVLSRQDALISKTESFTYDPVNRLQTSTVGGSTVTMVYSAAGRITSKTGVGSYSYGSGGAGPFAVTNANGLNYTYDANGRMITRGSDDITWYSYDLPKKIENGTKTTEFLYGPDRARYQQELATSGTPDALITYVGELYEFEDAATDTYRHYVQAGDRVVAVVERVSTTNTRQYLHRDHQGSVTKVTDASGNLLQALAFDAWGLRRDASDWSALGSPFAGSHETERGYTGHEHLDTVGLIHMNGRVQDPVLGRFISADPLIQSPYSTQSHNRYSYVWNNPTSFTDPSGFTCTLADMSGCGGQDMNEIYAWLTDQIMYWQSGEGRAWADFLGVDAGHIAQQYFNGISDYAEAYTRDNPIPTGRVTTVEMGVPNGGGIGCLLISCASAQTQDQSSDQTSPSSNDPGAAAAEVASGFLNGIGADVVPKPPLLGSRGTTSVASVVAQELPQVTSQQPIRTLVRDPGRLSWSVRRTTNIGRAAARGVPGLGLVVSGATIATAENRWRASFGVAGATLGGALGAVGGGVAGSVVPGPGTAIGGVAGAAGGSYVGDQWGTSVYDFFFED